MGYRMSKEALDWLDRINYTQYSPEQRRKLREAAMILYPRKKED